MCGRITLKTPADLLQEELGLLVEGELTPRYNIAPSQRIAVVTNASERKVEHLRWGLIPSWARDPSIGNRLINARAETAAEKPSFRNALRKRRCIILADGFYEWRADGKRKTPIHIRLESKRPFALAGLWEVWRDPEGEPVCSCTILTTTPNPFMTHYHDRMPVMLSREGIDSWLAPEPRHAEELACLMVPWDGEPLEAFAVSTLVNSPANDRPECVEPV
jgi:putative SOS response-associated peptidase YedK